VKGKKGRRGGRRGSKWYAKGAVFVREMETRGKKKKGGKGRGTVDTAPLSSKKKREGGEKREKRGEGGVSPIRAPPLTPTAKKKERKKGEGGKMPSGLSLEKVHKRGEKEGSASVGVACRGHVT